MRTTKYAEELLRGLDKLEGWPEKVRTMQRNWIGRSEGTLVDFKLERRCESVPAGSTISVFTTRVDTILRRDLGAACARASYGQRPCGDECQPAREGRSTHRRAAKSQRSGRYRRDRKARRAHRALRHQSIQWRESARLGCELYPDGLRHRRHHERARARRARLRIRQEI